MKIRDADAFSKICAGIQSIVITIGVIVGGVWTVYTFGALSQVNKSRAEIQKLELDSKVQAVVTGEIEAAQIRIPGDTARYISAFVTINNGGSRDVRMDFSRNPPFAVSPAVFDSDGRMEFKEKIIPRTFREDDLSRPAGGANVRSGGAVTYPFVARVQQPGLYLVTFSTEVAADEITSVPADKKPYWGMSRFIVVE